MFVAKKGLRVARFYDISLLPSLQEQAAFLKQQSIELVEFCEAEYGRFLTLVDAQSEKTESAQDIESLEEIYAYAASRLEDVQEMISGEVEAIEEWQKTLERVAATGDTALWADVAEEMLNDADFKSDANEFKAWAVSEMSSLKRGVVEVLSDWEATILEGNAADLAKFVEAIAEMEDEEVDLEGGDECCDEDEECGDECSEREEDDCCGRKTPCCRTEEEDEDAE